VYVDDVAMQRTPPLRKNLAVIRNSIPEYDGARLRAQGARHKAKGKK
jgi:hypothetical protein